MIYHYSREHLSPNLTIMICKGLISQRKKRDSTRLKDPPIIMWGLSMLDPYGEHIDLPILKTDIYNPSAAGNSLLLFWGMSSGSCLTKSPPYRWCRRLSIRRTAAVRPPPPSAYR